MFFLSFWTAGSSYLLPMSLLVAKTVFSELVIACLLAAAPTSFSPSLVKATTEGVVRLPSAFSMTFGVLPYMTATQELVVPRSIPMMLPFPFEKRKALVQLRAICRSILSIDYRIQLILISTNRPIIKWVFSWNTLENHNFHKSIPSPLTHHQTRTPTRSPFKSI